MPGPRRLVRVPVAGVLTMPAGEREFVDSNVFLYAFSAQAPQKGEAARLLLTRLAKSKAGCISVQVLQEFYANATRKLRVDPAEALRQLKRLDRWRTDVPQVEHVIEAAENSQLWQISFWDALIVGSAQRQNCHTLWTEDLNEGQQFGSVTVRNPFRSK